jgi:hypothetical protein
MYSDGPGDSLSAGDGVDRHRDDSTGKTVTHENLIGKGNASDSDDRDGNDSVLQPVSKTEEVTIL